jgi:hypothetical protein
MPITREFTVLLEHGPSALGKVCQALADGHVNILALHSSPVNGKTVARFIADDPTKAKAVLDNQKLTYAEVRIAQAKVRHRPGEIARLASLLGKANIDINYAYCGLKPITNEPLVFFAVADVGKAASILERATASAATD